MILKEKIYEQIEEMPEELLNEVSDFIGYLKIRNLSKRYYEITMASENILSQEWLKEEEDLAWEIL